MGFKFDGSLKLDINIVATITIAVLFFFQNQGLQQTNNVVADVQTDVKGVQADVKDVKVETQQTKQVQNDTKNEIKKNIIVVDSKVKKITDKLNTLGNTTKISDAQILQTVKQVLREVS